MKYESNDHSFDEQNSSCQFSDSFSPRQAKNEDFSNQSLNLLNSGPPEKFVEALKLEISHHPAIHHEFLHRLGNSGFSDTTAVLRDYAHQYSFYTQWFTKYLNGVISNLDSSDHQALLLENMEEEKGHPGSPNREEWPHVEIYRLFKKAVGADEEFCKNTEPCTTVLLWRQLFLEKCSSNIRGVGIAAIGLATEGIISSIYPHILNAIRSQTHLGSDASLFFELHVECDDGHAESIEKVTTEIAEDMYTREAIRFGVISSLNLRSAFWDAQLSRALAM